MFKAIDRETGRELISLDPAWDACVDVLREKSRTGRLVCAYCQQTVLLRAGEILRRHFAHKDLSQCPLSRESPELLAARAELFGWLTTKFPSGVRLEKYVAPPSVRNYQPPRSVDCWVDRPDKPPLAYWIVEGKVDPDDRFRIPEFFAGRGVKLNWVFLPRDARRGKSRGRVNLSTTERELLTQSDFDAIYRPAAHTAGSLHVLDADARTLVSFRALWCVEAPQHYKGFEVATPLSELRVRPTNGEFVHPGEFERWQEWKEQQRRAEEQKRLADQKRREAETQRRAADEQRPRAAAAEAAARAQQAEARRWAEESRPHPPAPSTPPSSLPRVVQWTPPRFATPAAPSPMSASSEEPEGTCSICGKRTRDWAVFDHGTGTCKCRDCLRG